MPRRSHPGTPQAEGFPDVLAVFDRIAAQADWDGARLGGTRWPKSDPRDRQILCLGIPRLTIVDTGHAGYAITVGGQRRDLRLGPGGVLHFASHAWNAISWRDPVRFLGLVFHRDFLRVLCCDHPGGSGPRGSRQSHHTSEPIGRDLAGLLEALDDLAAKGHGGDADVGACLRLVVARSRAHLAADLAGAPMSASQRTWQEVLNWLQDHCTEAVGRDDAARALGLHPNYLSSVCTRHGGRSFQRSLEALRLDRAKALLRQDADLPLAEIARRCGFADADRFGRVFRARIGVTPRRWARG